MKLELKHLAGYLPYGLEVFRENKSVPSDTFVIKGATKENVFLSENGLVLVDIDRIKPILRPLSDLTKEIEVNGEKFVPTKIFNETRKWDGSPLAMFEHIIHNVKEDNLPTWITQKLLEWHFDIYGLIEKGLAIDVNTLEK